MVGQDRHERRGYRGRFAPSPTGEIHLGTARTALLAWLRARSLGGAFVMRIEDLDAPRTQPGATERILSDLRWLGLDWDEGPDVGGPFAPYVQSERLSRYQEAARVLTAGGYCFECTCSRKEIAAIASAPHGDEGPEYPGTCRDGPTHPERERALRFRIDEPPEFRDAVMGPSAPGLGGGDFVLLRKDGVVAYQLACVVDDAAMEITEVVRGADLLSSTPRQLALHRALGHREPDFAHVPLVLGPDGARLAKRHGSISVASAREGGMSAAQLIGRLAASAGLLKTPRPVSPTALLEGFTFDRLLRADHRLSAPQL